MTGLFRGDGVLAIWNGIAAGKEDEFLHWHVGQHLPERLSVPGFLRARRYVSLDGDPRYFNFYEVRDVNVLTSPAYLERLNNPTDWTQAVVPHFTQTSRTLCNVVASKGHGCGGVVEAVRIDADHQDLLPLVDALAVEPDISGVTLLSRHVAASSATSESRMRSAPDGSSRTILLIEGAKADAVREVSRLVAADDIIERVCGAKPQARGAYQLDFLLDAADLQ
tara:strand:+ start:3418 stop:4086 length:669 start_codon:yes stop_codon:yes gene_type:complete